MSKYHAFLLIPCVFIYLASSNHMRFWLLRWEPYLALFLALLVFLPNLRWNLLHQATTFQFLLVERHGALEFSLKNVLIFFAGFMAFLSPLFALLVARMIPRMVNLALWEQDDRYHLLVSISLPPIIIFGLLSPFMHIGAHWVAVGYATLCLAVIAQLMEVSPSGRVLILQRFPVASIVFSLVLVIGAHIIALIAGSIPPAVRLGGRTHSLLIAEKQKELYGWKELSLELRKAVKTMPNPEQTFFITHGYRFASHLRYLVGATFKTRTTGLNPWQNQYSIWDDLESLKGWDAFFVEKDPGPQDSDLLLKIFDRVGPLEEIEIDINGFKVRRFYVIRCYGYKAAYLFP
jgi:4-amino-4-deoxy-L-arabinose transferase-like glycosyltransferase